MTSIKIIKKLSHVFYDSPIPVDLEKGLVDLYQNAFSVKEFFQLFKKTYDYKALVILGESSELKHIICYTITNSCLSVLNELIAIEPDCLDYLSDSFFNKYPNIHKINLNRIKSSFYNSPLHFRIWSCTNDVVAQLPSTVEEYDSKLGKSTRKNVKYYLNKLQREHHDFNFNTTSCGEISPSLVNKIINMNRSRMKSKNILSGYDSTMERYVAKFSSQYGTVTTISIKNKVVAGLICYDMGDHVFGETIAHDNAYNKSRIGQVCFYLTLRHFIGKGANFYHMMEGDYDYKYNFLGTNQLLCSLSIYRSAKYKFTDVSCLLKHVLDKTVKQLRYCVTVIIIAAKNRKMPGRRKA